MIKGIRLSNEAIKQVADWARAWVENETTIEETPDSQLTDQEKAGLVLLEIMLKVKA